jgi:WD40 repeat protein
LKQLPCYEWVKSVAYSPHDPYLLAVALGENIIIFDLKTDLPIVELRGHTKLVRSIAWDHHSNRLASASADGTIRIWNSTNGELIKVLSGHSKQVNEVAWNRLEKEQLASAADDGTVRIWDLTTAQEINQFHGRTTIPLLPHFRTSMRSVAFDPSNPNLLASGSSDPAVETWDQRTKKSASEFQPCPWLSVHSIAYNPSDPQEIAVAGNGYHNMVNIWNLKAPEKPKNLSGHNEMAFKVAYVACNGTYKPISGSADNSIIIWDPETSQFPLRKLHGHTGWVHSVACDPHNPGQFASGSEDKTVIIWKQEK